MVTVFLNMELEAFTNRVLTMHFFCTFVFVNNLCNTYHVVSGTPMVQLPEPLDEEKCEQKNDKLLDSFDGSIFYYYDSITFEVYLE